MRGVALCRAMLPFRGKGVQLDFRWERIRCGDRHIDGQPGDTGAGSRFVLRVVAYPQSLLFGEGRGFAAQRRAGRTGAADFIHADGLDGRPVCQGGVLGGRGVACLHDVGDRKEMATGRDAAGTVGRLPLGGHAAGPGAPDIKRNRPARGRRRRRTQS